MARTRKRLAWNCGLIAVALAVGAGALLHAVTSEAGISIVQDPGSVEAQEANRKLKLLNEALAANRRGFIRLSQAEINGLLARAKTSKDRTDTPVELVKAGVLLHPESFTFVTWHSADLFGVRLRLVWQRELAVERATNGWSLKAQGMRVGKVPIPEAWREDVSTWLGAADGAFAERKVWLSKIPTALLSLNEVSQQPELRLYSYVPVIREEEDPTLPPERFETSAPAGADTLTARLSL